MSEQRPLTVRDLIAALERLPGDTPLVYFDVYPEDAYTDTEDYPLRLVPRNELDPNSENVLCWVPYGEHGTPLDFAPNDASAGATPQQDPLLSEDELTYVEKQAAQWAGLTDEEYLAKRREIYARSTFKAGDKVILPDGDTCTITRYLGGGTWAFICGDGKERFAFDYMMRRSESTPTA